MTEQASTFAGAVDFTFWFILIVSLIFFLGVTIAMVYFAFRYHETRNKEPKDIHGNLTLEVIWTVVPTILVLMMFWYGWEGFKVMRDVPPDAMVVKVTAQMWNWTFTYPNGKVATNDEGLTVPLGKPVKLELASRDVLHSFFVPAFRVKEDAVPEKGNYLWFNPTIEGSYDIQCAEYCGLLHSKMLSKVHVVSEDKFNEWLNATAVVEGPHGAQIAKEKGCLGCHSVDGSPLVGPSFKGLFGKTEHVITAGAEREVLVNEAYLTHSMKVPNDDVVKGFVGMMPALPISDDEINEIINYIKELK